MVHDGVADNGPSRLRAQVRAVGRLWKMIAVFAALGLGLALAYSFSQPPTYRVSADILLAPTTFDVQRGGSEISSEEVVTQTQVVTSRPVAEMVQDDLSLVRVPDLDELVTVEALGTSRVLRITATSGDADRAAAMASSVANQYLNFRRLNTQQSLNEVSATLADRQQQLENRIDRLDEELADNNGGGGADTGALEAERRNLLSQLGQITTQVAGLDIRVSSGAGGDVLREPEVPRTPVAPQPLLTGILGLLAGLLIGVAAAILRNRVDNVVRDEGTVVDSLGPIPVLARIPRWKTRNRGGLITVAQPDSPASQAFQGLSTRLRLLLARPRGERTGGPVVLCTSAGANEGKTALAANLAVAAARVGMRVILVDADLRRDGDESLPGVAPNTPGLAELLNHDTSVDVHLRAGAVRNLRLLAAGAEPVNPTEMMASARMESIVASLSERADLVVLDTPPTLSFADSLEMLHVADLVLLATHLGRSHITALESVAEQLLQTSGSASVGAVVLDGTNKPSRSKAAPTPTPAADEPAAERRTDRATSRR